MYFKWIWVVTYKPSEEAQQFKRYLLFVCVRESKACNTGTGRRY